jgi:DNA helicase-2/ATP-dependent DNA helicase PcrA
MNLSQLIEVTQSILGHRFDGEQLDVIRNCEGPFWVVAGPGSGKTEVLIVRTLKLLFVDNIDPRSIIVTTFTEKAAKNLFDRILNYASYIYQGYPDLRQRVDINNLRVGTLHSLCSDIMSEYRYSGYENHRLLDDLEQYLFVYEHSSLVADSSDRFMPLWNAFEYLFSGYDPIAGRSGWINRNRPPARWRRARAAVSLFNRIVQDMIDLNVIQDAGGPWTLLAEAYHDYEQSLQSHRRVDFAHLQQEFLEFLRTERGNLFLEGDGSDAHPGIEHVMVDEYQDTNPIQEAIYLELARRNHNLCVVGDDDQALYRFRGGTVDCMVTFDRACSREWGISFAQDRKKFLSTNYRSHSEICRYYDSYISSFPEMAVDNARVSGKPQLTPGSQISGNYPSVAYICGETIGETAENFARLVRDLLDNQIIERPSQCALLMRSVRETKHWAGPFASALRDEGIQPYNPRSRTFLEQEEIKAALGAFISIIDPHEVALAQIGGHGIRDKVNQWINGHLDNVTPALEAYVDNSLNTIRSLPRNHLLKPNILDILYRILSQEPFVEWKEDPESSYRLGRLTKMFESYSSISYPNRPGSSRGKLKMDGTLNGQISLRWRKNFYYSFVGLLVSEGVSDPEYGEIITPPDRLPIMTVYQAKGLEFPFVFVYRLILSPGASSSIRLEEDLSPFRQITRQTNFTPEQRALQDLIRFYYVAYSRAQYALIHLVPRIHLSRRRRGVGFISRDTNEFRRLVRSI